MVFKPSATLREPSPARGLASGDTVFRLFLGIAVAGCVWTTLISPRLPTLTEWVTHLVGA